MERLWREAPEVALDGSQSFDAIYYRARYTLDPAFQANEIRRTHVRKARVAEFDDGTLTAAVVQRLFAEATDCPYCGEAMHARDKTLDHVTPKSRGGRHSITNVLVCCKRCNASKGWADPYEFLQRLPLRRRVVVADMYDRMAGRRAA